MELLSTEDVEHIARLASLGLSGEEVEQMRSQLSDILEHFQSLTRIDTEGADPTGHTTDAHTILREDIPGEPLPRERLLDNAPDRDGDFVRVRPVLD